MKIIIDILKRPKYLLLQFISLILLFGASSLNLIMPVLSGNWLDEFLKDQRLPDNFIIIAISLSIFSLLIPYLSTLVTGILTEILGQELRTRLLNKYLEQNYEIFNRFKSSKLFTIFTSDINQIKDLTGRVVNSLLSALIMLIGSLTLMFRYNAQLALAVLLTIPIIMSLAVFVIRKIGKMFKKIQKSRDAMNKTIEENIKGSMLIKVFTLEGQELLKFNKINEEFKSKSLQIVKYFAFLFPTINLSLFLGQLLVLYLGGRSYINSEMTLGQISAFNMLVVMFTAPFIIISFVMNFISQALVSLQRVNEVLNTKIEPVQSEKSISLFEKIQLRNISYKIANNSILNDIDLNISKGQHIGLIGTTGSGKSTLLKLIMGIIRYSKGEFEVNGNAIAKIDPNSYQELFGYVAQQSQIFAATLKDNIAFFRDISTQDLNKALKAGQVDEFLDRMEGGLDTMISERGGNLSGGQKQRIIIARALAGNPQILVLDDATAKLDSITENKVMENIKKYYPEITIINVSSKISSLIDCDIIHILDKGKIIESGKHEELLKTSLIYQEIELAQSNYHE